MRTRLFISFLIIALLTAASPVPQFVSTGAASVENTMMLPFQLSVMPFLGFDEMLTLPMISNPKASPGCLAPKGLHGPTAPFKIEVLGAKKANININGTSRNGNYVIYCSLTVKQGIPVIIELMWGKYVYLVSRDTKTTRGNFFINNYDKATMLVYKDKIKIGPYP